MSKLFNAQNCSSKKWKDKEYLIYFNDQFGNFSVYRYASSTGDYKLVPESELIQALKVYVSYSYLGGIHLCNYSFSKVERYITTLTFTLNKVNSGALNRRDKIWDLPSAAFISKSHISNLRGIEPIKTFTITFTGNILTDVEFTTFNDININNESCNYGLDTSDDNLVLALYSYQSGASMSIIEGYNALNNLFMSGQSDRPSFFSFRVGSFVDNQGILVPSVNLIAAYYHFIHDIGEGSWYRVISFIYDSDHSFEIDHVPDTQAIRAMVENEQSGTQWDTTIQPRGEFMTSQDFMYYSIDHTIESPEPEPNNEEPNNENSGDDNNDNDDQSL